MLGIPPNSLFSVLAFIGFLLAGLPLPWHIQSWNMGTCMFMLWTSLGCIILFVNSIVWNDNVVNWAPVWCDISARYIVGGSVGIPASSLCIIRRLYHMTKLQTIFIEKKKRRRKIMLDVSIGIGLPCVVMTLEYVVQAQRFSIYEQIGCYPNVANTLAAYLLIMMWPLLIGLISLVYAVLTFRRAFLQKEHLEKMLDAGFSISTGHYWRLMALCSVEIIFTVPLNVYIIILDVVSEPLYPYTSWAWVHVDVSQIDQYPSVIWQNIPGLATGLEITRWSYILCAFIVFAFFGWAQEARGFYRQAFWSLCRRLGYSTRRHTMGSTRFTYAGKPRLPVHDANQQMRTKHPSMPAQARVRHHPLRTSLSAFEAPSPSESLSPSLRLSVGEGSTESIPTRRLTALSDLARHTHISWPSMLAAPEPVLVIDRRSRISSQEVGQLV